MGDAPQRMRFSENIRWLIQRNTRFGGTGVVHRRKVEEIGDDLGMSRSRLANSSSISGAVYGMCTPIAYLLARLNPPKRIG
jgi:hypothetical protein